ncbi:M24 family metallopeptidase [Herbaspirillum sp. alder98]|uniref:M24 family metallopeptidase n=1 Tax=Herbaspirillum sp. alder98 TaxID=2913096 RepID=UPI001CD85252|nr:Xaa-Pro peptidase family protein [Herbaspirillum sp. alder98]MCA1326403.1 Xaa-Pro peptidase family protein [Herbaspirillum sp. alder98]
MSKNTLLFSPDEYQQRIATVRSHMRQRGIDLLLIDQTEFLFYLTGFSISENMYRACLLPADGAPVMILRAVDEGPFLENSWISDYIGFLDWEDPLEVVANTIKNRGWGAVKLGLDEESYCMTLRRFKRLKELLPSVNFADFSGVLEVVRASKSPAEIAYLRRAAHIADVALTEAVAAANIGTSERDTAGIVHSVFMRMGADSARAGIITSGTGDAFLHGNLHSHPMACGDILHMELLPYVNGYSARLMRPAVIAESSQKQRDIAEQLLDIQDKQFAAMKPGASAAELDAMVREAALKQGLRNTYPNITGYSLGYFPLSTPRTSDFSRIFLPNSDWELQAGMCFHMYVSASGIAFSETVLVTENGMELLTKTPRQLFVAGNA